MVRFNMHLAEKNILVEALFDSTEHFCRDYITGCEHADVKVALTLADILAEREKAKAERELEGLPPCDFPSAYLETLALYRKIAEELLEHNIILFHGSTLSLDGKAYIFTAKSGTGKSTHTRLWREVFGSRVRMINDDKPLINISDEGVTVFGTPWRGKHNLGENTSAPLTCVCVIERSPENRISPLSRTDALMYILPQIYRINNPSKMKKILFLADKLLSKVKVYKLGCNMDTSAALVAYEGMKG